MAVAPDACGQTRMAELEYKLTMSDHFLVCRSLKNLRKIDIERLGGALGLSYPKLQNMSSLPDEMVAAWLNRQDDVLNCTGEPTWNTLVKALRKIEQNGIAEDILTKHMHSLVPRPMAPTSKQESSKDNEISAASTISSEETREDLYQRITTDMKRMKFKFSSLQNHIWKSIADTPGLVKLVLGMNILSEDDEQKVRNTPNEVDTILTKYWSFLDYENFEHIVESMCGENEKRLMKEYSKEVKVFCERRVSEFPPDSFGNGAVNSSSMRKLCVVLILDDPALKRIKHLKIVIANILGCCASELVLHNIGCGSVLVTILLTTLVGARIFRKSLCDKQKAALREEHITSLTYESTVLFSEKEIQTKARAIMNKKRRNEELGEDGNQLLDTRVSEYHIYQIALDMKMLEILQLAPYLNLTQSELEEISHNLQGDCYGQKKEILSKWRSKNGDQASYKALIKICRDQQMVALAERIATYPDSKEPVKPMNIPVLESFCETLVNNYQRCSNPSKNQMPSKYCKPSTFPIVGQCQFLDLSLQKGPLMTIHNQSRIDAGELFSNSLTAVTLQDALSTTDKKLLVYFEGIGGSGKTMLSWHACKEWTSKRLLKQFELLIHIQLNKPEYHSAVKLEDIIPSPDRKIKKEVAEAIISLKGEGVCFLLDGLDEASHSLINFLLCDLIPDKLGCPNLSFILTSRPDIRITEHLVSVFDFRIVIAGFKSRELHQYFDVTLGSKSGERQKLAEICTINPRVESLCSLPINAAIMSFLICYYKDKVPATQTELYKSLIIHCLRRHMDSHFQIVSHIQNLNKIPAEIREPFNNICSLAYSCLLCNKQLFTADEMAHNDTDEIAIDNTLGFLQIHSSLIEYGAKCYYSFDHLSLQEFLAAIHLTKMKDDELFSAVKKMLDENPLSQILPFYAGLSGLKNRDVLRHLSAALSQSLDVINIEKSLLSKTNPGKKVLAFFNCLFECQHHRDSYQSLPETNMSTDSNIIELLNLLKQANLLSSLDSETSFKNLIIHGIALTPVDCLSLGYYLHMKFTYLTVHTTTRTRMTITLDGCSITHTGIRAFTSEFKKSTSLSEDQCEQVKVYLLIGNTTLDNEAMAAFKELIQGPSHLSVLTIANCHNQSIVELSYQLKCLTEGLSNNSSCVEITVGNKLNGLKPVHIYYIILMLRASPQLRSLGIPYYDLSRIMPLFCRAVTLSYVQYLELMACNISDSNLVTLGRMICNDFFILGLDISFNPFSHDGLSEFLRLFVNNPFQSQLAMVVIESDICSCHKQTLQLINMFRALLRRPPLNFQPFTETMFQQDQAAKRIRKMCEKSHH